MSAFDKILLGHGSGGTMMKDLIDNVFFDIYGNAALLQGDDAAILSSVKLNAGEKLAFSTDSFVVRPHFFPGGDIGKLAICGTVNDISTSGAVPKVLSIGFILEEGFPVDKLQIICKSIAKTAKEANVSIVTGDTKVVENGLADGIYINTSGVGVVSSKYDLSGKNCKPDDVVLVSGSMGDHGISIVSSREGLEFSTTLESDVAPLNNLIQDVLQVAPNTKCFRDPTRGGLASTLNEFANQSNVDITINEVEVPFKKQVVSACELLGYDPLQVANEGKIVCVVPPEQADDALSAMRASKYGKEAAIIGYISQCQITNQPKVYVQTKYKTKRILDMLVGQQLPRIC